MDVLYAFIACQPYTTGKIHLMTFYGTWKATVTLYQPMTNSVCGHGLHMGRYWVERVNIVLSTSLTWSAKNTVTYMILRNSVLQESLLEITSLQFDIQASLALNHDTSIGLAVQQFLTHQERL